jgi:hypothetical protein
MNAEFSLNLKEKMEVYSNLGPKEAKLVADIKELLERFTESITNLPGLVDETQY